jgi:hypothetical protein
MDSRRRRHPAVGVGVNSALYSAVGVGVNGTSASVTDDILPSGSLALQQRR